MPTMNPEKVFQLFTSCSRQVHKAVQTCSHDPVVGRDVEKYAKTMGIAAGRVPIVFSHVPKLSLTLCDFSQTMSAINWLGGAVAGTVEFCCKL